MRKSYQLLEKLGEMTSIGDSEDSILLHESVIRGHHVFKEVWSPRLGEILLVDKEAGNHHDRHAVALLKADKTPVGHVPREFSRTFWRYLSHGGKISCEVTGRRKYGKGLEVPCVYKFFGSEKLVKKMKSIITQKSSKTIPQS